MKKSILTILIACFFSSLSVTGQKKEKLLPVTQSELTGIPLPAGTIQDKRFLSIVSVKTFIEQETKQAGVGVKNPEVFRLPHGSSNKYGADSLVGGIWASGWSIAPMKTDKRFAWLKKGDKFVMSYFSIDKNETLLYFAEADSIPTTAGTTGTIAVPPGTKQVSNANDGWSPSAQTSGKPAVSPNPPVTPVPAAVVAGENANGNKTTSPVAGSFVYHTTNFDDGWTSTIAEEKVIVTRGNLRVFIYQTVAHTDESRSAGRIWAWDHLVSRDFNIRSTQYRDHGEVMSALQAPYIEGQAVEKSSGQNVFIAMYSQSVSGQMLTTLAIAPDEQTIRNAFPKAEDKYESDLNAMRGYNRFAVDARDLNGTWEGGDGAAMGYYDAITGGFLGLTTSSFSYKFVFGDNNSYSSVHQGAGGTVGNMKTYHEEYKGTYALDKWSISMNNRWKGETENFNCYFEVVRGGRILHMQNKQAIAIWYHLMKKN